MSKNSVFVLLLGIILTVLVSFNFAQPGFPLGSCPAVVEVALDAAASSCDDLARNQACYGHSLVNAQGRDETVAFEFEKAGDRADLQTIVSMDLSPLNIEGESWGVSILKVQANLPDTLPGQNVTFVLFGDTYLEDQTPVLVETPLTTTTGVNVRLTPAPDGRLLGSLGVNEPVTATGRYGDWVRIDYLYQRSQITGWVIAAALSGDFSLLPEVERNARNFSPMQSFYFTTGIGEVTCREAPIDGLLIQTPQGEELVNFVSNGAEISMEGTAFLQATPGEELTIQLLQGEGVVTFNRFSQRLVAGSISRIALDSDGWASGLPSFPVRSFDCGSILNLIASVELLPEAVNLSEGACLMPTAAPTNTTGPNAPRVSPTPTGLLNLPTLDPAISPTWTPIGNVDTPIPSPTLNLLPCEAHPTDFATLEAVNNAPSAALVPRFLVIQAETNCTASISVVGNLGPSEVLSLPVAVNTKWYFRDDVDSTLFYGTIKIDQAGVTYRFCYPTAC
ncbi:MAG: SH3 domain-containing protein [Anaerolineae bacterium]|jgi:hypothetical protein|nr:SH3 domain-containing protein [Anaerolineae bacterium]